MYVSSVSNPAVRIVKLDVRVFTPVPYSIICVFVCSIQDSLMALLSNRYQHLLLQDWTLKMEAVCSPEILVTTYQATPHHMLENRYQIFTDREKSQNSCIKNCFLQHFLMCSWLKKSWHTWYSNVEWHFSCIDSTDKIKLYFWACFIFSFSTRSALNESLTFKNMLLRQDSIILHYLVQYWSHLSNWKNVMLTFSDKVHTINGHVSGILFNLFIL
jgi:hypothetical protein